MHVQPDLELDPRLKKQQSSAQLDLTEALDRANAYRQNLETLYNQVTDPAVVDSIIHQMIVAEQNYNQLLQRARTKSLINDRIPLR